VGMLGETDPADKKRPGPTAPKLMSVTTHFTQTIPSFSSTRPEQPPVQPRPLPSTCPGSHTGHLALPSIQVRRCAGRRRGCIGDLYVLVFVP